MFTTFSPTYFPVGAAFPRACASVRPPGQGACLAPWGTLSIRHRSPQPSESPPSTSSSPSSGCCSPFPGGGGGGGALLPLLPFRSMRASTTLSFHPRFCGRPASGGAGLMASSTRGVGDGGGREDGSARRGGRAWTLGGFGCETLGSELSWMARSASLPISSTKHGSKEPSLPPLRIPKILGIVIHTMEPKLKKGYQPKFSCLARRNEISPRAWSPSTFALEEAKPAIHSKVGSKEGAEQRSGGGPGVLVPVEPRAWAGVRGGVVMHSLRGGGRPAHFPSSRRRRGRGGRGAEGDPPPGGARGCSRLSSPSARRDWAPGPRISCPVFRGPTGRSLPARAE